MSSSKGNVVLPKDLLKIYLPEIVRYFYAGTKPVKEFSIPLDEEMSKVYEDFYQNERVYFGAEKEENKRKLEHLKRVYEMSMLSIPKSMPEQLTPQSILNLAQLYKPEELLKMKNVSSERSSGIIKNVLNWIEEYGQGTKVSINSSVPADLSLTEPQRKAMKILASELSKEWTADDLQKRVYSLKDDAGTDAKSIFQALYTVLINKTAGPRAGEFILSIGKDKVRKLLEQL